MLTSNAKLKINYTVIFESRFYKDMIAKA